MYVKRMPSRQGGLNEAIAETLESKKPANTRLINPKNFKSTMNLPQAEDFTSIPINFGKKAAPYLPDQERRGAGVVVQRSATQSSSALSIRKSHISVTKLKKA